MTDTPPPESGGEPPAAVTPAPSPAEAEADRSPAAGPSPDTPASAPADAAPLDTRPDAPSAGPPATQDAPVTSNTIDQAELDALAAQLGQKVENAANTVDEAELAALTAQIAATGAGAAAPAAAADLQSEMAAAIAAEATPRDAPTVLGSDVAVSPAAATPFQAQEMADTPEQPEATIDLLDDVQLDVKIELGRTELYIEDVLRLGVGSVVELNKLAGDPVDIYVNERLIARGEVLVLNDNFCVRINNILSPVPELEETS